ncbi:heparinase II/III domain-containing protein [Arenicella chitinivorans]|uniref:heparinase II/III domain-containing protein n=1 Tax=Arenicella chitinivorans TaxID=1329800 RepID=UPI0016720E06|nr:heparinase II/III family protein [Arenicella chitinivorans]
MSKFKIIALVAWLVVSFLGAGSLALAGPHPGLTMSAQEVVAMRSQLHTVPKAKQAFDDLQVKTDTSIELGVIVPKPVDAGGGYTHEQHKRNYQLMLDAGLLYQLSGKKRYANYVRDVLLAYAELYPTLPLHPKQKEQSPGKLFWQSLNEAVWLVHTIQAYDLVVGALTEAERNLIESSLLRPVANFLSEGQPDTFNKIHNHGTWAAAAVGMTGYVLDDQHLVDQALFGLDKSGKAGFIAQIEQLFSPDGYYTEGPYYQRYALMPFVLFARAIEVNEPQRAIFEASDGAILKAIETAVQLSYNGLFFGINDAIKDKGIDTIELVHGIAIAFEVTGDTQLLDIAKQQNHILLTGYGFSVAKALHEGRDTPFDFRSLQLRDGQDGQQGALSIFRHGQGSKHQALVVKNTSQGMGHGHFDKLHWLYFDNGNEIISDYGAARFLNIEAKYGGHYLPENNAWAKQTVAHNTVVVDEQSHFNGDWRVGQQHAPNIRFFAAQDGIQITSAEIAAAYPTTTLRRTMAMLELEGLTHPLILDVFKVNSVRAHQYDLPLHYQGQLISHTLKLQGAKQALSPLGEQHGYQYLWDRARAAFPAGLAQLTWLNDGRFYTYSTVGGTDQQMLFAMLGANDPQFNLRDQHALIHRVNSAHDHVFVSVLETHGEYNGRAEYTVGAQSNVVGLAVRELDKYTEVTINLVNGHQATLLYTEQGDENTQHQLDSAGGQVQWQGHFVVLKSQSKQSEQ